MNRQFTIVILILALCVKVVFADILEIPVNCTFKDKEVGEVTANLAKQANVEILVDPALKGKISLELGQIPLEQAIKQIAIMVGGFPGFVGGKIYLASLDPKGPYYLTVVETRVVPIGYLEVGQIIRYLTLDPIFPYLTADEVSNSISITAPGPVVNYAEAVIKGLDERQDQVQIETTIIDDSSIGTKDKGVQFTWSGRPGTISFANTVYGYTNERNGEILFNLYNYYTKDQLKILAQPSVVVQNGKTANSSFGKTFYATIGSAFSGTAKIEAIRAGVSLKVTPRVIRGPTSEVTDILINIEATVDDVVGTGSGTISVTTNSRTAMTTLCVKNGETIIIGGLISSLDYRIKSKTPFLGDIPLIGNLFRSSRRENRQQKVTILLTARVVEPEKAVEEAKPAKEEIRERTPTIGVPTPPAESTHSK